MVKSYSQIVLIWDKKRVNIKERRLRHRLHPHNSLELSSSPLPHQVHLIRVAQFLLSWSSCYNCLHQKNGSLCQWNMMKSNHQCPEKPSSHLHMPTEVTDPGNNSQENEQYGHTNSAMPCLPEATILLLMSTYLRNSFPS